MYGKCPIEPYSCSLDGQATSKRIPFLVALPSYRLFLTCFSLFLTVSHPWQTSTKWRPMSRGLEPLSAYTISYLAPKYRKRMNPATTYPEDAQIQHSGRLDPISFPQSLPQVAWKCRAWVHLGRKCVRRRSSAPFLQVEKSTCQSSFVVRL